MRSARSRILVAALVAALSAPGARAAERGKAPAFWPVDLSEAYNADIFTRFESRTDGQVDAGRSSFPAETMPRSGSLFRTAGVEFRFPFTEDGARNAVRCEGQRIPIRPRAAPYLYLLATAADGDQQGTFTLTHEDGTSFDVTLHVNDWCAENPALGGLHGLVSDYRHTLGGKQECKTSLWLIPIRLRTSAPLVSLGLPRNPRIFVVAATLGPPARERAVITHMKDAFFPSAEAGVDRLVLLEVWEPSGGAQLELLAQDNASGQRQQRAVWTVPEGTTSLPVWLPLVRGRSYFFAVAGHDLACLDETNLFSGAPEALLRLEATRPAHPADAEFGMAPAWHIVAQPESELEVALHLPWVPARYMTLRVGIAPRGRSSPCAPMERRVALPAGSPASHRERFPLPSAEPGDYAVSAALLVGEYALAQAHALLTIAPPSALNRPFGARETWLRFEGPVWTNWDEAVSYGEAWAGSAEPDIVVDFPGQPYRYVFWKGASYAPIWLFDRCFVSLEWMEAWPRQEGAVDCIEPLQDKLCQHSRVKLLSSSPARARVRWSYAMTDFALKIIHNERAEEEYTLYPDGIGARKVTGFFEKGRWHEVHEFIVGSVAGTTPSEHFPPQTVTLLNCAGDRLDLFWPTPQSGGFPTWSEYIGVVRLRRHPSVFTACAGRGTGLHVFSNTPDWLPEVFFCMPHWPLQRGLPTTNARSIQDCRTRATHASLLNLYAAPHEVYKDRTVWALLIGIAPEHERELRDLVRGWLRPAELTVTASEPLPARYDLYQRAYVIETRGAPRIVANLAASAECPQVRPAFVLRNPASLAVALSVNGRGLEKGRDFESGTEDDGATCVVWVRQTFAHPTELVFEFR